MKSSITKEKLNALIDEHVHFSLYISNFPSLNSILVAKDFRPAHPLFADNISIHEYIKTRAKELNDCYFDYHNNSNKSYNNQIWLLNIIKENAELKNMTVSEKSGCNIDSEFANFLRNAPYLENLTISEKPSRLFFYIMGKEQTNHLSYGLRANTALKRLDLSNQRCIGDEGLSMILDGLRYNKESQLAFINLSNCGLTDKSAEILLAHLKENNSLLNVNIQGNNISDELAQYIDLAIQQKKLSINTTDLKININEPSPIVISHVKPTNKRARTETVDKDHIVCVTKKQKRM